MFQENDKINFLTIIKFSHYDRHHRKHYLCKCDCGKEKTIQGSLIKSNNTRSCGCYSRTMRKNQRISNDHSEVTAIILGYKRHAINRGFVWMLSREDVLNTIFKNCFYCESPPSNTKKTKNSIGSGLQYNGIDRVDSSIGYIKSNIVPCCKTCNIAKQNLSIDQFKMWAIRLGNNAMADQWGCL